MRSSARPSTSSVKRPGGDFAPEQQFGVLTLEELVEAVEWSAPGECVEYHCSHDGARVDVGLAVDAGVDAVGDADLMAEGGDDGQSVDAETLAVLCELVER